MRGLIRPGHVPTSRLAPGSDPGSTNIPSLAVSKTNQHAIGALHFGVRFPIWWSHWVTLPVVLLARQNSSLLRLTP